MSYMTGQGLLKTLLLTNSNFSAGDVTEGNLRVLDQGRDNLAVLFPGAIPAHDLVGMRRTILWDGLIELYQRFEDFTSYADFGTLRDSVITTIETGRSMSGTYWVIGISSEADPVEVYDTAGGGPFYIMQRLRVAIQENV